MDFFILKKDSPIEKGTKTDAVYEIPNFNQNKYSSSNCNPLSLRECGLEFRNHRKGKLFIKKNNPNKQNRYPVALCNLVSIWR